VIRSAWCCSGGERLLRICRSQPCAIHPTQRTSRQRLEKLLVARALIPDPGQWLVRIIDPHANKPGTIILSELTQSGTPEHCLTKARPKLTRPTAALCAVYGGLDSQITTSDRHHLDMAVRRRPRAIKGSRMPLGGPANYSSARRALRRRLYCTVPYQNLAPETPISTSSFSLMSRRID
jgi:hypothetical protein